MLTRDANATRLEHSFYAIPGYEGTFRQPTGLERT
jgi:hypothetical protein